MEDDKSGFAMARYEHIAPAILGTIGDMSKAEYYRRAALVPVTLPDGSVKLYSPGTLASWEHRYRHGGFDALAWGVRSDAGEPRALTPDQCETIEELRDQFPKLCAKNARLKMIELGHMKEGDASERTFQRYFKNHPRRGEAYGDGGKDRLAFEMARPNQLWQGDTLFGPYCVVDEETGRRGRSYVQALIDDRTRLSPTARAVAHDNGVEFQGTFRGGIELRGVPDGVYLDHGAPYENKQITGICGRLGVVLKHAPVRDGAAKGKIERFFRTLRSRFLAALPDDPDRTITEFNDLLQEYIMEYNNTPHSALGGATPQQAWDELTESCPPRMPESAAWLDECFLNRDERRVNKDATVRIRNVLYDVPQHLVGQRVELAFTPGDTGDMWVVGDGGKRTKVEPTDKHANANKPREVPRYRLDYTKEG